MLDADLANLYGVGTGQLVRAVKRNADRFPPDFMFQLSPQELASLRCQNGISSAGHGGRRYAPYAFTEHGVAMLSAVLHRPQARCAAAPNRLPGVKRHRVGSSRAGRGVMESASGP